MTQQETSHPPHAMAQIDFILPTLRALDDTVGDLLIVSAFADERPLTGLTGLVDWRLAGALSRLRMNGFSSGSLGERILYPGGRRLSHPKVMLMGLGHRTDHRADRAFAVARSAIEAAVSLGAERITTAFFGLPVLPSPLERTSLKLTEILCRPETIQRVALVADHDTRRLVKEGVAIFGRSPD